MGAGQIGGIATLLDIDFHNAAGFIGAKADVTEAQYVVYFMSHAMMFCMGTLIEAHVVLTTAGCVMGEKYKFEVFGGTHTFLEDNGIGRLVEHLCVHRGFNQTLRWESCSPDNLALLVLSEQFSFHKRADRTEYIMSRLRYGAHTQAPNGGCRFYGWGSRRNGYMIPLLIHLRKVEVTIKNSDECLQMFNYGDKYLCVQQFVCKSSKHGSLCPDFCRHTDDFMSFDVLSAVQIKLAPANSIGDSICKLTRDTRNPIWLHIKYTTQSGTESIDTKLRIQYSLTEIQFELTDGGCIGVIPKVRDDLGSVIECHGFLRGMMTSRLIDRPCGVGFLDMNKYIKFLTCGVDDSRDIVGHNDYMEFEFDFVAPKPPVSRNLESATAPTTTIETTDPKDPGPPKSVDPGSNEYAETEAMGLASVADAAPTPKADNTF